MIITFARRIAPRAKNNQDRRAIFIQAGYKGNPRDGKKIRYSCGPRCFKDYIHVRPSAFLPAVDGRIRALIKLMQPPRASCLSFPSSTSRGVVHVSGTCARVGEHRDHGDFYERCHRVPARSYRLVLTGHVSRRLAPKKNAPSISELVFRYVSSKRSLPVIIEHLGAAAAISDV